MFEAEVLRRILAAAGSVQSQCDKDRPSLSGRSQAILTK